MKLERTIGGVLVSGMLVFLPITAATAQTEFEPHPIEQNITDDPLFPQIPVDRPLSPMERTRLDDALDTLNSEAIDRYNAGNKDAAFEIWYRELRLRRILGYREEIAALAQIGEIAWNEDRRADVRAILARLETLQEQIEAEAAANTELFLMLGNAYEEIHAPKQAISVYQQLLAEARSRNDLQARQRILNTIGELHLAWFNYRDAAATYEQLLDLAAQTDNFARTTYLQQLARIYDQAAQPINSIRIKRQLVETYRRQQQRQRLAPLLNSLAADYAAIDEPDAASMAYQEAFEIARMQQQYTISGEALQGLGELYLAYDRPDAALQIYFELLKAQQIAYDYYGIMNTWDRIGQIYVAREDYEEALKAFEQGLRVAESLDYQQAYFVTQIEQVNRQRLRD